MLLFIRTSGGEDGIGEEDGLLYSVVVSSIC